MRSNKLRIGVGGIWHESSSFSALETTIGDFGSYVGITVGSEVFEHADRQDEVTGFIDVLRQRPDVNIVPLMSAGALPSGLVTEEAAGLLEKTLRRQLRAAGDLDGLCFALHGAMSAVGIHDLDGHFLAALRDEVGPEIPIVCSLDCHAIITRQMVALATALVAYRTHPHVDLVETGMRAAEILLRTVEGELKPVMDCRKVPMILPPPDNGTNSGALKELFDVLADWDQIEDVVVCSLCPSFAWQDVPEQGWAALAVTNANPSLARRLASELAQKCWESRLRLLPAPMVSPREAVQQALATPGCPVVITDSADTTGAGAPGDSTGLLDVLLSMRDRIDGLIIAHLPDAEAVGLLKQQQLGASVTVAVGGKRDTRFGRPIEVTGTLLAVADGIISDDGHFTSESVVDAGSLACLGVGNLRLVLSERAVLGPQPSLYRKVGIEPFAAKIVALKTGVGYKVTYGKVVKAVIRADCPGAASYDLNNYQFRHLPRPMFPIDVRTDYQRS